MKIFHNTRCDPNAVRKNLLVRGSGYVDKNFDAGALGAAALRHDQITGFSRRTPVYISQAVALTILTNTEEIPCATRPITFADLSTPFPFIRFLPRDG